MTGEIVYRLTTADKPGDPADKAADGAFGGVHSHRAGYGDDKLDRLVDYLRRQPRATLASGEGALLLAEIDRLRDDLHTQADWADWAKGEIDRLTRILAALREPSAAVIEWEDLAFPLTVADQEILAAVKAAEQEVGRE